MVSSCFEYAPWRGRLLTALAGECARLGADIAALGTAVADGHADTVALQAFDVHTQAAQSLSTVLGRLGEGAGVVRADLAHVPLPRMRARLQAAMDGTPVGGRERSSIAVVIWQDVP